MRARQALGAVAFVLILSLCAHAGIYDDNFSSYPEGSSGGPAWEPGSVGWHVESGAMVGRRASGPLLCRVAGFGRQVRIEATITITEAEGGDWLTAGIGVQTDPRNHWRLNLVRGPKGNGAVHYTELNEMRSGAWPAGGEAAGIVGREESLKPEWTWQQGVPYRVRVTLDADRIEGTIATVEGEQLVRYACRLSDAAVGAGWAVLSVGGMVAVFDDVSIEVAQPSEPPAEVAPSHQPYAPIQPGAPVASDATGYFRVAEVDGRWWVIDPSGRRMFIVGTDHCRYSGHWCESLGYAPYGRNCEAMYGSAEAWAAVATKRLKSWNFHLLGAGNGLEARGKGLAHTEFASFGQGFARTAWIAAPETWTGFPDVFHPDWDTHCRLVAKSLTRDCKTDPWLFGYFLDNELEWFGKSGRLVDDVFRLPAGSPAKQALVRFLLERCGGNVAGINAALGSQYADAAALEADTTPPRAGDRWGALQDEFLGRIAELYFGGACKALREADPNHLILGCRFAGMVPEPVLEAAARYVDVFTINTYPRVDLRARRVLETPEMLVHLYGKLHRPMMITEWSFPALDAGLPCKGGAGMRVDTQEQKALCYEVFANTIARLPFMVGQDYFMWVDEPAQGISSTFPEDSNYGLVDVNDHPWQVLVDTATRVNGQAAEAHAACPLDTSWTVPPPARTVPFGPERVPGANRKDVDEFTWELGPTRLTHKRGSPDLFSEISAGDFPLGHYSPLLQERLPGGDRWVSPTRTESLSACEAGGVHLVDAVLVYEPPNPDAGGAYRIGCRAVARDGWPCAVVQVRWVENAGDRPIRFEQCFHYPLPAIGDGPQGDDVGGPHGVPNYYLASACWTDPRLGGWLGVTPLSEGDFSISFWKSPDGGFHADARRSIGVTLDPGRRWESDEPWMAVYGFGPGEPEGWRTVAAPDAEWKRFLDEGR